MTRLLPTAIVPVVLTTLALAACSGGDAPDAEAGVRTTVDSTGGVVRVTNTGAPARWSLEPLLAIDRAGGEELGRVTGVVGDWAGYVYVADAIARRIYRFGPEGELVATLGGRGGGPGEFRSMRGLAFVGGRLATLDAGSARIHLLSPDGKGAPETVRWQALGGDLSLVQTAPGEAYAQISVPREGERISRRRAYVRLIGAGVPDTLAPAPALQPTPVRFIVCEGNGLLFDHALPYDTRGYLAPAPGGRVVAGNTGSYRLAVLSPAGDTVRVIARDIAPPPVSDAEWGEEERAWGEFRERVRGARCNGDAIQRPASKPAFDAAFHDDRGRLWVEAWDTAGFRFDVFDTTGVLVGELPAPPDRDRSVRPYVRTGRLFYVAKDSMDVQTVRVASILESAASGAANEH